MNFFFCFYFILFLNSVWFFRWAACARVTATHFLFRFKNLGGFVCVFLRLCLCFCLQICLFSFKKTAIPLKQTQSVCLSGYHSCWDWGRGQQVQIGTNEQLYFWKQKMQIGSKKICVFLETVRCKSVPKKLYFWNRKVQIGTKKKLYFWKRKMQVRTEK
ncbi:hypothetical protein MsAg5_12920 [Methanosarcinaceae archaeon Ag5]|uniref:Uncharacterized protein n=1 Tax=Methanolapillus africanus TaxID=3028297 RepID=A0AAE4MKP7_9EURY|nr:hypothetical protein [Methanosarcinaceae archaeon Ag5]